MIAVTCIFMGAGLPTTALYIMLATVAQPALGNLGVPPLASHLFVLYYGVISEITPPVCASATPQLGLLVPIRLELDSRLSRLVSVNCWFRWYLFTHQQC